MGRRNLTPYQRSELALILKPLIEKKAPPEEVRRAVDKLEIGRQSSFKIDAQRPWVTLTSMEWEMIAEIPDKKASPGGGTCSLPVGITKKESHLAQTERAKPGPEKKDRSHDVTEPPTLSELGLTKCESAEAHLPAVDESMGMRSDGRDSTRDDENANEGERDLIPLTPYGPPRPDFLTYDIYHS